MGRAPDALLCGAGHKCEIVSALLSSKADAATVQVIQKLFSDSFCPVISKEIMAEYTEVLHRAKFHFSPAIVEDLLFAIEEKAEYVIPASTGAILPDMKDLPFYEVVMEKRADDAYLVTGNQKHFPAEPFIVTAREFLAILEQNEK